MCVCVCVCVCVLGEGVEGAYGCGVRAPGGGADRAAADDGGRRACGGAIVLPAHLCVCVGASGN